MQNSDEQVNVICLKWGRRYGPEYTNTLYAAVREHLHRPFRFVCVTEDATGLTPGIETAPIPPNPGTRDAWPNVFLKLLITKDGFADLKGPTLFFDVDIALVDDIDCFFDYMPGKNCIIHNWIERRKTLFRKAPAIGNSSVFRFEAGSSNYIYETFVREIDRATDRTQFRTEQAFLTYAMRERYWWPDAWVQSFKRHCMWMFPLNLFLTPTLPTGTKILVFHGRPDPDEALKGYRGRRMHQYARPASWIAKYWNTSLHGPKTP
jgi:hypothetical protein